MKPRPVRVYVPDRELNTTWRKNVAWKITCKRCGHEAKARTIRDALAASHAHECESVA